MKKEEYIKKGMDEKYAEYFASGTRKIIRVEACSNYHLKLYFDNGEIKVFNVQPLIEKGNIFQYLQSVDRFNSVYLNDGVVCWDIDPAVDSNIEWNNRIDLSPDTCYVESKPIL